MSIVGAYCGGVGILINPDNIKLYFHNVSEQTQKSQKKAR